MTMRKHLTWRAFGLGATMTFCFPAVATALPFSFAPNSDTPPLAGSSVPADTISYKSSVNSVVQPDRTFIAHRILLIDGFSLNGNPVAPTGFGSSYGLYFDVTDTGGSAPPLPLIFLSSSITLKADPGNHNGAVSS